MCLLKSSFVARLCSLCVATRKIYIIYTFVWQCAWIHIINCHQFYAQRDSHLISTKTEYKPCPYSIHYINIQHTIFWIIEIKNYQFIKGMKYDGECLLLFLHERRISCLSTLTPLFLCCEHCSVLVFFLWCSVDVECQIWNLVRNHFRMAMQM